MTAAAFRAAITPILDRPYLTALEAIGFVGAMAALLALLPIIAELLS